MNVELREIGNFKINIRPNTSDLVVAEDNLIKHSYEKAFGQIQPNERWIDIGGYIGTFAIRVLSRDGEVYSFEPFIEHVKLYKKNLECNNYNSCNVSQVAVMQYCGGGKTIDFNVHTWRNNFAGSSIFKTMKHPKPSSKIIVPCISFKEAVGIAKNSFVGVGPLCLKLDAEGIEMEILEGLDSNEFNKITLEYHFKFDPSLDRLRLICDRLEKLGYKVKSGSKIPNVPIWPGLRVKTMHLDAILK